MVDATSNPTGHPDAQDADAPNAELRSRKHHRVETAHGKPRIAVAHEALLRPGDTEAVLDRILGIVRDAYTPAGLYCVFGTSRPIAPFIDTADRTRALAGRIPVYAALVRTWLSPLRRGAVEALSAKLAKDHAEVPVNLLVSTSDGLIKGMKAPPGVRHLCYVYRPALEIWNEQQAYPPGLAPASMLRRAFSGIFNGGMRAWDRRTIANADTILVPSRYVAAEVERCWARDAIVVPPPVRTGFFTPDPKTERQELWLTVANLHPRAAIDLAIEAAIRTGTRLAVVGTGPDLGRLRAAARKTARTCAKAGLGAGREKLIEFTPRVDHETLRGMYRRAKAFIQPGITDFGVRAVEAQACGCPVVARRAGAWKDTLLEGRTGVLFDEPNAEALRAAAERLPRGVEEQCREHAERFSEALFDKRFRKVLGGLV